MAPDLNSLPASRPPSLPESPSSQRPRRISLTTANSSHPSPPSPRSPALSSLQAAATINAGLQRPSSNASPDRNHQGLEQRRRSSLLNNLSINDPTVPAPGEMQLSNGSHSGNLGSRRFPSVPTTANQAYHHHRQPSLGELHQELENEQEAQVNHLLHLIRVQQDQIANIHRQQQQQQQDQESVSAPTEQTTLPHSPSTSVPTSTSHNGHNSSSSPYTAALPSPSAHHFNRPGSFSRQSSHRLSHAGSNSRGNSPALRPHSGSFGPPTEDLTLGSSRDECAFYQAETQMLTRENQMLKLRIRELERQITDMSAPSATSHNSAIHPGSSSLHANQPTTQARESTSALPVDSEAYAKVD